MRSVAESPVSMETWFMSVSCAGSVVSVPCLLIKSSCSLFIIGSPPFKYLWIAVVGFIEKALKEYMMCSLYASVQAIEISPFLPHGAVLGLWLHLC